MTTKAAVAAWLAEYHSDHLGRDLTPAERMLAEEIMLDFILEEPSLDHDPAVDLVQHALATIQTLVSLESAAAGQRLAACIEAYVRELTGRLKRQEHANLVMREHLTMMSTPKP